ncbi:MAG: uracil-DNA glycosylase [Treponema sp.]|nr:uracil-DNA glycosylase [Treponema sp.]
MKKEEKELIFNLLKTADANVYGYTRDIFAAEREFSDDIIKEESSKEIPAQPTVSDATSASDSASLSADNANSTQKGMTLDELNAKIMRCTRCQLARTRNNVVPGQGVEAPLVLVVGEGPGAEEDARGLPFVGKAGILLDKMLAAIKLYRDTNCYIANIVKCRPPENRNPLPEEEAACFSFLEAQIHILKPKMILCMGKVAAEKLLDQQLPITQYHGHFFEYKGIPLMPTYHPSALLRNEALKRPAWEDLKGFRRRLDQLI